MPVHQVAPLTCRCGLQSPAMNCDSLQRPACSPSFAARSLEQQQDQPALSKTSSVLFMQCHCISQKTCELSLGLFYTLTHLLSCCYHCVLPSSAPCLKEWKIPWQFSLDMLAGMGLGAEQRQEIQSPLWIWNLFSPGGVGTFLQAVKKDSKTHKDKT